VGDLAVAGRAAVGAGVGDDHRAVAEPELGPVVLADPHPLLETERRGEPRDRGADVGIGQDRDDRRGRDGTVRLHGIRLNHWFPVWG
jgi:hypothetical protein